MVAEGTAAAPARAAAFAEPHARGTRGGAAEAGRPLPLRLELAEGGAESGGTAGAAAGGAVAPAGALAVRLAVRGRELDGRQLDEAVGGGIMNSSPAIAMSSSLKPIDLRAPPVSPACAKSRAE